MAWASRALAALVAGWLATSVGADDAGGTALRFVRDGEPVAQIALAELRDRCGDERVEIGGDPYYGRRMAFLAVPLHCALELGFGAPLAELVGESFLLRALDGYTRPAPGSKLALSHGYLAFADAAQSDPNARPFVGAWAPSDRQQGDPGPFYLIWDRPGEQDIHLFPWPYQLATIEIASVEASYPDTLPTGAPPDSPARAGFDLFRRDCIACHAVNGQGGTVGPELNVPRSIVEYRTTEQIKQFVRDPASFRYTSMPSNPQLDDADLDALVAYFTWMKDRKRDPRAKE